MARRGWPDLVSLERPALGTWTQIASEECVDMLGAAGLDFTIVDMEHGAISIETAERLFRAADANDLVPMVRIARPDPSLVGQALDAGAAVVIAPGVESAADARALVAGGRYAPDGTRGACPCIRAGGHFVRDWRSYVANQRTATGVMALVETRAGLEAIEEICNVEGLLGIVIGPFDLSVSLGLAGDYMTDEVQRAIDRMIAAAKATALPVFAPIFSPDAADARVQQESYASRGADHFIIGTDKILFSDAVARYTNQLSL